MHWGAGLSAAWSSRRGRRPALAPPRPSFGVHMRAHACVYVVSACVRGAASPNPLPAVAIATTALPRTQQPPRTTHGAAPPSRNRDQEERMAAAAAPAGGEQPTLLLHVAPVAPGLRIRAAGDAKNTPRRRASDARRPGKARAQPPLLGRPDRSPRLCSSDRDGATGVGLRARLAQRRLREQHLLSVTRQLAPRSFAPRRCPVGRCRV